MLSCNSNSSNSTTGQQAKQKSVSLKSTTRIYGGKKDSVTGQEKQIDKVDEDDIFKKLIGTWTLKEGKNAIFEISKSTFYYPEHSMSYKYTIVGDSIKIKYDDFEGNFLLNLRLMMSLC